MTALGCQKSNYSKLEQLGRGEQAVIVRQLLFQIREAITVTRKCGSMDHSVQEQPEGRSRWLQHADLLGFPRGTAKKPEIHGSSGLPKLPELQLVLFCTWATLQGTQSS